MAAALTWLKNDWHMQLLYTFRCMKQHNRIHFFLQNEARKLNHQEVAEEDRRSKLPKNFEARKRQLDWEEEQETKKQVGLCNQLMASTGRVIQTIHQIVVTGLFVTGFEMSGFFF